MNSSLTGGRGSGARSGRTGLNRALADASLVACPECDLVQRLPDIPPDTSARCPRCNKELWRRRENSLQRTLPLAVAALVLYVIANCLPMLGLSAAGRHAATTVVGGAEHLWHDHQQVVAVLVVFAVVISPALHIGFLLLILLGARRPRPRAWVGKLLHRLHFARTWSMIEVMLLGVLVALTKIAELATIIPGLALFALFALVFVMAAIQSIFDPHEVWNRVEWAEPEGERPQEAAA